MKGLFLWHPPEMNEVLKWGIVIRDLEIKKKKVKGAALGKDGEGIIWDDR